MNWRNFFRRLGRMSLAVLEWVGWAFIALLTWLVESLGGAILHGAREIWRWAWRSCFGNFQRTVITMVVAALVAAHFWPQQVWPVLIPWLEVGIALFAVRLMLSSIWPMKRKKSKKRR